MRFVFAGIEYSGKTTIVNMLQDYYRKRGRPVHGDDHFTIPDASLSPDSQVQSINYPNDVKERNQRMQIHYHVEIIRNYENVFVVGWHLEEAVYTSMYGNDPDSNYYPNYSYVFQRPYEVKVLELRLPDVVLVHTTASDEAIRERIQADPHKYQVIKEQDISELKSRFDEEIGKCLFKERVLLDTTGKTPQQSLDELLLLTEPYATTGELAVRMMTVPDGEFDVVYENGLRKMIPKA